METLPYFGHRIEVELPILLLQDAHNVPAILSTVVSQASDIFMAEATAAIFKQVNAFPVLEWRMTPLSFSRISLGDTAIVWGCTGHTLHGVPIRLDSAVPEWQIWLVNAATPRRLE